MGPRIKGVNLVPVVKALRKMDAAARERLDPAFHHYLEARILVSTWYPESDALELMRALVKLMPMPEAQGWVLLGKRAAKSQAEETYRAHYEQREVVEIVRRANVLWRSHHDTGELRVTIDGESSATLDLIGYVITAEWCDLMLGYCMGLVEAAGAPKSSCKLSAWNLDQLRASFQLSWTPPVAR